MERRRVTAMGNSALAAQAAAYVSAMNAVGGAGAFVANACAQVELVKCGELALPMTINDGPGSGTYVNSFHAAYSRYSIEEASKIDGVTRRGMLRLGARTIGAALQMAHTDQVVHVNNWLLSTNPYPDWNGDGLDELLARLTGRFPRHFIVLRSLTRQQRPELMARLGTLGFDFLPSRAVWVLRDIPALLTRKRNLQRDHALLSDGRFVRCSHEEITAADFPRIRELYAQLYLVKYSRLNPAFTDRFFEYCHRTRLVEFEGVRDANGLLVGICGCLRAGGMLYQPVAGYDITRPVEDALYRRVEALAVDAALRAGLPLHLSAGVGAFKRNRGAEPEVEYSAVYSCHLAPGRRLVIRGLARVLESVVVPMVRKREL